MNSHRDVKLYTEFMDTDGITYKIYTGIIQPGHKGEGLVGSFMVPWISVSHHQWDEVLRIMRTARATREQNDA